MLNNSVDVYSLGPELSNELRAEWQENHGLPLSALSSWLLDKCGSSVLFFKVQGRNNDPQTHEVGAVSPDGLIMDHPPENKKGLHVIEIYAPNIGQKYIVEPDDSHEYGRAMLSDLSLYWSNLFRHPSPIDFILSRLGLSPDKIGYHKIDPIVEIMDESIMIQVPRGTDICVDGFLHAKDLVLIRNPIITQAVSGDFIH